MTTYEKLSIAAAILTLVVSIMTHLNRKAL